jgi:hypothetical protein
VSTRTKRPARSRQTASRSSDRISHLHVVIDDELRNKLEAYARKRDGKPHSKHYERQPNLSAAVRDLLRSSLGLPAAEAA